MTDRTLGYSVILFLVLFVFIPTLYLTSNALAPLHQRTIVFDSINTGSFLRIQDPVRLNGFETGLIQNITWDKGKTYVKIETEQPLSIHQGYKIIAEAKGLMGDRYLEINPGQAYAPLMDKKELLYGSFPLGPTEAIAFAGKLGAMVDSLVKTTMILKNGSADKPSFISRFHLVAGSLDSITASLSHKLKEADRTIGNAADSMALASQKADTYSRRLNKKVPEILASLNSIFTKTEKFLIVADSLAGAADLLMKKVNGPEVVELSNAFIKIKRQIGTVREFLNEIRNRGFDLPLKTR